MGNRKKYLIIIVVALFFSTSASAGDFTVRRQSEGYVVDISIDENPPIMGKNNLKVIVKAPSGEYVIGAPVAVNYYMPPMPGMPPMNYTVAASPKGKAYTAAMNFIMTGPWNIALRITVNGKVLRVKIPIDVR